MIVVMRKLLAFYTALATLLVTAAPASAQLVSCPPQFKTLCDLSTSDTPALIGQLINFAFVMAILVALGFLIYGGVKWITSGGDKTDVEGARNHVIAAVVGLVIVFLSYFVINIVTQFFSGSSLGGLTVPKLTPVPTTPAGTR